MSKRIKKNRKIALITGSARRIGSSIVKDLHKDGIDVILHYNNSSEDANKIALELNNERKDSCFPISFNLRNFNNYSKFYKDLGAWSNIDILINNASTFYPTDIQNVDDEHWNDLIDVNLKAPFFLSKLFYSDLKKNSGVIINIVDIYSDRALKDFSIYSLSKSGLKMLTKSLAIEFGPHVRVNGVSPGSILWPEVKEYENEHKAIIDSTALKRQGESQDISSACLYLIKDANYVTGQVINVDGGRNLNF
ncbi:MAG: pteridine reductase [Gammaproteobacteria bacterium]|nr:pteridine reductase [Gammaproteobacteria bacterium]|tara:strand:+ start:5583 stop:6332 length:750 start_codon:yes stop_codon:yes gene_type:complete